MDENTLRYLQTREFLRKSFIDRVGNTLIYEELDIRGVGAFRGVHCGVLVLDYSKRIMNEVMCLAEDFKIPIFYQDTDSMQIPGAEVPALAREFEARYGRELIGDNLGQFHEDFGTTYAPEGYKVHCGTRGIYLAKKLYYVQLLCKNEAGNEVLDHHARLKGISSEAIVAKAEEYAGPDKFMRLYADLARGVCMEFDLCSGGKVRF